MTSIRLTRRAALLVAALALAGCAGMGGKPPAQQIHVMTSGGFTAAYNELTPQFERSTGTQVHTAYGASMGAASDSIPSRLGARRAGRHRDPGAAGARRAGGAGQGGAGSQVDLVRSSIGFAVRAGAPKPDISTVEALKRALLAAPSIAYSASASGVYYETELLKKLGIEDQVKPKSKRILSERVGTVVARGEAALGLQQVSELLPIEGIDFIGVLPPEVQRVTVFSAGISTTARAPEAAQAADPATSPRRRRCR